MHEEHLVKSLHLSNGTAGLDYLIYPLKIDDFKQFLTKNSRDIHLSNTELLARINLLEKIATTDELTNLKNRRYLWEFCRQIIELEKAGTAG